jgi:hypothetical protein
MRTSRHYGDNTNTMMLTYGRTAWPASFAHYVEVA